MQVHKKSNDKYLNSIFLKKQKTQISLIPRFQQLMETVRGEATYDTTNCVVEATHAFEKKEALVFSTALVTLTERKTLLQVTNTHNHTYTLGSCVAVATFKVITTQRTADTEPVLHVQVLLIFTLRSASTFSASCSRNRRKPM